MVRFAPALLLASCSWLTVTPPAAAPQPPGDCTTSPLAPTLDLTITSIAVLGAVLGGVFVVDASRHTCRSGIDSNCETYGAEAGFGVLVGVPSVLTALTFGA